ncbi:branched-chain amino acid ABC transporter permease [Amorphus sp. 3PC139-8]|uniref:branched-chain amino acid ABC transporter permease n=1 Tax=Amorphus sp. 3PC139-8 TaxID=2735676 RepID=UPI00345D4CD5
MLFDIATIVFNALTWAMATFLVASGLTLIFGVLHILNFSHGGFLMLGAYLLFSVTQVIGDDLSFAGYLAVSVGAGIVIAAAGLIVDLVVFRRLRNVESAYVLIATYALLLLVEGLVKGIWGAGNHLVVPPEILIGAVFVGPVLLPYYSLFVIVCGVLAFIGLEWFLFHTTPGKLVQAVAIDPWMSSLLSVNVERVYSLTIVIGFALAGLAGGLLAANQGLSPQLGGISIIQAFGAIIVGGMGSIRGAFYAAILLGLIDAFGTALFPAFPGIFFYVALAGMILVRPKGLISSEFAR